MSHRRPGYGPNMELNWIRNLTPGDGPFATVYLDVNHTTPDDRHATQLRWHEARDSLAAQGADEAPLRALDEALEPPADGAASPSARLLVAAGHSVLIDRPIAHAPDPPRTRWAAAPELLPALTELPEQIGTVVAVVDATGADLWSGSNAERTRAEWVDTGRYPLHKVRGGALAHLSMQRRVEENARASAVEIATAIEREVARTGSQLLVLAGEVQARSRVRDALGSKARELLIETDVGGRAPGSDDEALQREVARLADECIARIRRAAASRYEQAAGRDDGTAVEGIAPVVEQLRAARVETLYVDADAIGDSRLWVGPEPSALATDPDELTSLHLGPVEAVPAAEALLLASASTRAACYPVGGGHTALAGRPVAEGVAAVLRAGPGTG